MGTQSVHNLLLHPLTNHPHKDHEPQVCFGGDVVREPGDGRPARPLPVQPAHPQRGRLPGGRPGESQSRRTHQVTCHPRRQACPCRGSCPRSRCIQTRPCPRCCQARPGCVQTCPRPCCLQTCSRPCCLQACPSSSCVQACPCPRCVQASPCPRNI